MRQEMIWGLGCSGISWTICKQAAPCSRQITTPTPRRSIFKGRILFLMPNQQCQSTEGTQYHTILENKLPVIKDRGKNDHRRVQCVLRLEWSYKLEMPGFCDSACTEFCTELAGQIYQTYLTHVGFWAHVKIASRIVSYRPKQDWVQLTKWRTNGRILLIFFGNTAPNTA